VLKYLTYIGKLAGFVATLNVIPFVDPAVGVLVFAAASLLKDTVNRIGDLVDDGFAEPASRAERHPLASLEEFAFCGRLLKEPLGQTRGRGNGVGGATSGRYLRPLRIRGYPFKI
jgi:hypothetical protein